MREERIFSAMKERLSPFMEAYQGVQESLPVDMAFLSDKALEGLINADLLSEGSAILQRFSTHMQGITGQIEKAVADAGAEIAALRTKWDEKRQQIEVAYQSKLRELQKEKIDGDEFIKLRQQIEALQPLRERKEKPEPRPYGQSGREASLG